MTVIIDEEELPQGYSLKFKVEGITFLVLKRGKRNHVKKEKVARVYSDSDHEIIAETMREIDETQTHSEQLIPQYSF